MRLVTRLEMARIAGVSAGAITRSCKGGPLEGASQGRRIDLDHPAAMAYLRAKGVDPATAGHLRAEERPPNPRGRPRGGAFTDPGPPPLPSGPVALPRDVTWEEIERFADRSLRELSQMFGTSTAFRDWLDALRKLEDTRSKHLRNEETQARLISRELVQIHVFGALDGLSRRMLGDAPKTIAQRILSLARSGGSLEEAEAAVRDILSSQIRPVKDKASRTLREAARTHADAGRS